VRTGNINHWQQNEKLSAQQVDETIKKSALEADTRKRLLLKPNSTQPMKLKRNTG